MNYHSNNHSLFITIDQKITLSNLFNNFAFTSKLQKKIIHHKLAKVKNKPINLNDELNVNDILELEILNKDEIDFEIDPVDIEVIYEDELFLVVNKPAGLMVHPDDKSKNGTLANRVAYYYLCNNINTTIRPIHRLDTLTQGLVIFSKCPYFQPLLDKMLQEKEIRRDYYALVDGYVKEKCKYTINKCMGKDRHDSKKYRINPNGYPAITHIEGLKYYSKDNISLINCRLETGRTHQIRVHLNANNHPIINDPLYGKHKPKYQFMGLEAYMVSIKHPITKKIITAKIDNNLLNLNKDYK